MPRSTPSITADAELAALRAEVDALRAELRALTAPAPEPAAPPADDPATAFGRRRLFALGAAGAAAGVASLVTSATPAAAATGQPIVQGSINSCADNTQLVATGAAWGFVATSTNNFGLGGFTQLDTSADIHGVWGAAGGRAPDYNRSSVGVLGESTNRTGVRGVSHNLDGVEGYTAGVNNDTYGVWGTVGTDRPGHPYPIRTPVGVAGEAKSWCGVRGNSDDHDGVEGYSLGTVHDTYGVYAMKGAARPAGPNRTPAAIDGESNDYAGIRGVSQVGTGVQGYSVDASANGFGVYGEVGTAPTGLFPGVPAGVAGEADPAYLAPGMLGAGYYGGLFYGTYRGVLAYGTTGVEGIGQAVGGSFSGSDVGAILDGTVPVRLRPPLAVRVGPPTSGTFKVGDISVDTNGAVWCCRVAGANTAAVWRRVDGGTVMLPVPVRVLDTREAGGRPTGAPAVPGQAGGARAGGSTITLTLGGNAGIPAEATGVIGNLTSVAPTYSGFATLFPATGGAAPPVSTVNFVAGGQPTPNGFTAGLGAAGNAGKLSLFASSGAGAVHLIVDITGYLL